ncbi:MAG: PP2C family protein-serine/threonine phosphatase [Tepidisphaeraceae bacterium]|jgi:serine phosphatase RsbU (regulator of sigma subunit)
MEELARRYARKILLIHLLLLGVIAICITLAARGVYNRAREQALEQFLDKQSLLAHQTSNGIETHYRAIVSSLDILERDQRDAILPFRLSANMLENATKLVGHQLTGPGGQDRVAALMVVGRTAEPTAAERPRPKPGAAPASRPAAPGNEDLILIGFYPPRIQKPMQEAFMREVSGFLKRAEKPTVGMALETKIGPAHVIAYPSRVRQWVGGRMVDEVWFVAVVPVEGVKARFLDDLGRRQGAGTPPGQARLDLVASLIDERGVTMACSDPQNDKWHNAAGAGAKAVFNAAMAKAMAASVERLAAGKNGLISFRPSADELATIEPVSVVDKTWFLLLTSPTSPIDEMVSEIFRKALWWAVFVVATMTVLLVSSSTALIRAQLRVARVRNEVMNREMAQARRIQLAWLPQASAGLGVDIAAVNEPASHVSGDFYDWFELRDGRIVISIGDVTGHGMSAAFLMATTQLLIRNTMMRIRDPGDCLTEVNRQLCGQVFNGQFVTVCVLILDLAANTLEVASAGHYAPLLHDGRKVVPLDADSNLVLGVEHSEKYSTESFILPEVYAFLLYTDGVIDARSRSGEPFDSMRLRRSFARAGSASDSVGNLVKAIHDFRAGAALVDDMTLVVIQGQASRTKAPLQQQGSSV